MKKLLLVLLVLLAIAAILVLGKQPDTFPPQSASAAILEPGAMLVARYDEVFVDVTRPTQSNNDYPGDSVRSLGGTVWHPVNSDMGPFPLIVYSHGFSSNKNGGSYLAEQLATLGYVVVAVNYPLTHFFAPGGPNVKDVVNQPGDVSFLIDSLLAHSNAPGHALHEQVDVSRIGVMGISLGGLTSELVAFHPTMGDPRVAAALSIAGPTAMFTETFFTHAQVPFMMLAGGMDAMVPHASNATPILEKVPGSQLVTIVNGSHTGFSGIASALRWLDNPDALGCWIVQRNIESGEDESWFELLGSPQQGINYNVANELCQLDPLPKTMNVLRQQMITKIIVSSFFQSHFAPRAEERDSAQIYLSRNLDKEIAEVRYRVGR